jgi:hypothetical protein
MPSFFSLSSAGNIRNTAIVFALSQKFNQKLLFAFEIAAKKILSFLLSIFHLNHRRIGRS